MLIAQPAQLSNHRHGRLLGVDHGSKTLGLAISDAGWRMASPLETIVRGKFAADLDRLKTIVTQQPVSAMVIGYPLNMDGSEGPRCQSIRAFVRNLEEHFDLPMLLWDERLSSFEADGMMLAADLSRQKRKEKIDKVAASLILQSALDKLAQIG